MVSLRLLLLSRLRCSCDPPSSQVRAKCSLAEATSRVALTREPAVPIVWVELAAAMTEQDSDEEPEGFNFNDEQVLGFVQDALEAAEGDHRLTEAMLVALEPELCEVLKGLLAESGDAVGGLEPLGAHLHQVSLGPQKSCSLLDTLLALI